MDIQPLVVWDTRDAAWSQGREAKAAWLRDHGLPADNMYRAEFYVVDAPFVRVFTYHRDEQGRRHFSDAHIHGPHDHEQCCPAVNAPYDQPLWEFPPGVKVGV